MNRENRNSVISIAEAFDENPPATEEQRPGMLTPIGDASNPLLRTRRDNRRWADETQIEYNEEEYKGWFFYDSGPSHDAPILDSGPLNPQALNRHAYVLGCPTRFLDPSGHSTVGQCATTAAAAVVIGEASTVITFGGIILMGSSITVGGITFGTSAPVSAPVLMVGVAMEVIAFGGYATTAYLVVKTVDCIASLGSENLPEE